MSDDEEMVAVDLDNDYYTGPYISPHDYGRNDYLIPRSQLERWKAAQVAYEAMQAEIEQVMDEQRERASALRAARFGPKSPMQSMIEELYKPAIISALQAPATFRRMTDGEPE